MPLLILFALKALLDLQALTSNNVRGGTCLAEVGGAKKSASSLLGGRYLLTQNGLSVTNSAPLCWGEVWND